MAVMAGKSVADGHITGKKKYHIPNCRQDANEPEGELPLEQAAEEQSLGNRHDEDEKCEQAARVHIGEDPIGGRRQDMLAEEDQEGNAKHDTVQDAPAQIIRALLADAFHIAQEPGQDADTRQRAPGQGIAQFDTFRQQRRQTDTERGGDDKAEERITCAAITRMPSDRISLLCFVLGCGRICRFRLIPGTILAFVQGIEWRVRHHDKIVLTAETTLAIAGWSIQ